MLPIAIIYFNKKNKDEIEDSRTQKIKYYESE
jgi:hypothetical protein